MCGRVTTFFSYADIEDSFDAVASIEEFMGFESDSYVENYNAGPGALLPIVLTEGDKRLIRKGLFGLCPPWAAKPMYLFNARAEGDANADNDPNWHGEFGIFKKPAFRNAIRTRRCLIPVNGFIEGTTREKLDKPHYVKRKDEAVFALGAIWEPYQGKASFSIITTVPNSLMQQIPHHRMPLILDKENYAAWLNPQSTEHEIAALIKPYPADELSFYPIHPAAKNPRNNSKAILEEYRDLFS